MSNYPPGVTGNEYAIAGPDSDWEEKMDVKCENDECEKVDEPQEVVVSGESYAGTNYYTWDCPLCSHAHDFEREEEGPDPDDARDAWLDSLHDD
jgi:hypothetical protein